MVKEQMVSGEKIKIRAIFFDIGGVLVSDIFDEFDPLICSISKLPLEKVKLERKKLWNIYKVGKIDGITFIDRLGKRLKIPLESEVLMKKTYGWIKLKKDVISIVRDIEKRKYLLGVITNNSKEWSQYERDVIGLGKYFQYWSSSDQERTCKPCRTIFDRAIKKFHLQPKECLFIDNMQYNVDGARRCGMRALLFKDSKTLRRDLKKLGILG